MARLARFQPYVSMLGVAGLVLSLVLAEPEYWWRVGHHLSQAIGDAVLFTGPIVAVLASAWGLVVSRSLRLGIAVTSRRPMLVVGRAVLDSVKFPLGGFLAACLVLFAILAASGPSSRPSLLHLTAALAWIGAFGALGLASSFYLNHALAPVLAGLASFALVAMSVESGASGSAFVSDLQVLHADGKGSLYLAAQIVAGLSVAAIAVAAMAARWKLAAACLAAVVAASFVAGASPAKVERPEFSDPACSVSGDVLFCMTAMHEHLLEDVVEVMALPAEIAQQVAPIDVIYEAGIPPSSVRSVKENEGAQLGRDVVVEARSGYHPGVDILDPDATLGEALLYLVGVEQCSLFEVDDADLDEVDDPGADRPIYLTSQGEVVRWYLDALADEGVVVPELHDPLPPAAISSGLASQLDDPVNRGSWMETNRDSVLACKQVDGGP